MADRRELMTRLLCVLLGAGAVSIFAVSKSESPSTEPQGSGQPPRAMVEPISPENGASDRDDRRGDREPRVGERFRGPGGGMWERFAGHPRRLTPQQLDRVLQIITEIDPERGQRLCDKRQSNPAEFEQAVTSIGRSFIGLIELEDRHPQLFRARICELKLQAQARRLAIALRSQRASLRADEIALREAEIRRIVTEQVGCGLQARGFELLMLAKIVEEKRAQLKEDSTNFAAAVDREVDRLLKEPQRDPRSVPDSDDPRLPANLPLIENVGPQSKP